MTVTLDTKDQRTSYALGLDIAASLQRLPLKVDLDCYLQGLNDMLDGKKLLLEQDEFTEVMRDFQAALRKAGEAAQEKMGTANMAEGQAYQKNNGARDGVTTTESGLQYEMVEEGDGASPDATDTVTVHYCGTLINGSKFDSSYDRGEPATFPLNQVIPGWTEGVQLMRIGAKYRFVIPSGLAYGENGAAPAIGPDATLIFEIELISIQ